MVQENRETQFMVRCSNELRVRAEKLAKEKGQSLVEWVRRAIKEQIEREEKEKNGDKVDYMLGDESLDDRIAAVILAMKKDGVI